ncbi:phosphotransferase [Streptomyces sp. NPDC094045]|uniref:phosphotransferase n=1 Tax=unclassified Streptomyces TaxID=2593676 RepID=UPI002E76C334|nr:phosphotransferase [Streptomyces sp. JV190]MEE1842848.1 phosphotransferase [Streptomyces sp. JV190]
MCVCTADSRIVGRVTDANVADRTHLPTDDLAELIRAYDIDEVLDRQHLADGLMNVNWRLGTRAGRFALKRVTDVPLDRLRRNLAVLPVLASYGVPVCAPLRTVHGDVIAEVHGGVYCLFSWSAGEHVRGTDLSLTQTSELGTHLAGLHTALGRAVDEAGMPAVPASVTAEVTEAGRAVQKADRLTGAVSARGAGDAFDRAAGTALEERKILLEKHAHLRPEGDTPAGPQGWTHGDFQYRNLLWADGGLVAVLDWDRLGVRPYAEEVVRTAQVQFGVEGVFDLERVTAFVAGYRSVIPLEPAALLDAARRLWWKRMTDFWQLEFHYDRGDHSCDELFIADEALLHWWTERLDAVERAFTGSA